MVSALAALAVLSFAAAPMNGYAVDEESLDDELAVAVTTEAPVIAGTVVTTDTPPQITSNVSETSMTTTVTDEYGNYIDEDGNITPATTSVSTQTETTTTTTKASTELSQIPLSGTYTVRLRIRDVVRQTPVLGLNCEVFCLQTGDVVAKWNTSDVDEIYIENLKYEFDSHDSYTGNIRYAIRITNLPENYVFLHAPYQEECYLSGSGLGEFKYGTDLDCTVELEDIGEDAPIGTAVTGTHPIVTTSTAPVADTTEPISNTTAPKDTGTTISIPVTDPETSVTPVPGTTATTATTETTTTTATVTNHDALSEEQAKALAELAEKEHGVFGEFERARASILNKIPEDVSRMTLEEAKEFVNSSDSFKEIYDKLSASQPYPDFIGGSGVTKVEYWFDDKGKEKILLILEQEDVIYVDCTKQGDVSKWERLYPVSGVEDSNIKDSNLAGTYKIYNGIKDTVTTEPTTTNYKNITQEDFKDWAMKDYATKTGNVPAKAALLETVDGNYAITLTDEDGEVLDVYTVNPETATGTNMANEVVSLPQTGYSDIYKVLVGLATLMTVSGGTLIVKTREKE